MEASYVSRYVELEPLIAAYESEPTTGTLIPALNAAVELLETAARDDGMWRRAREVCEQVPRAELQQLAEDPDGFAAWELEALVSAGMPPVLALRSALATERGLRRYIENPNGADDVAARAVINELITRLQQARVESERELEEEKSASALDRGLASVGSLLSTLTLGKLSYGQRSTLTTRTLIRRAQMLGAAALTARAIVDLETDLANMPHVTLHYVAGSVGPAVLGIVVDGPEALGL